MSPIYLSTQLLVFLLVFSNLPSFSQETNSNISGIVKSEKNELLQGATVMAVHEPTKNTYYSKTNPSGYFYFFNLKPGGPYTIQISYIGYESVKKTNLFLSYSSPGFYPSLQEHDFLEFILKEKTNILPEIKLIGKKINEPKFGTETNITNELMNALPSISRNLQDYVRVVPQAKTNGEGMMSLAGQNNKYNAFFIDGSNNNDLLGVALSGTNGGQTASPPISIEAIEEIKVLLTPYDVQYSNFTGGSINAITKSGTNQLKSSAWYFFRNEQMAGRSPTPVEKTGTPGVFYRPRLSQFFNQTAGVWVSGPLVKDKLLYFLLGERQHELQPQPFDFSHYKGNSPMEQLVSFADTLSKRYNYSAGSFLETKNQLKATRFIVKLDWNPSEKNKLTFSVRYNFAERLTPQSLNNSTTIRFSNNGYIIPTTTYSTSFEWKTFFKNAMTNRLLFTYTDVENDANIIGQAFPSIIILDGVGRRIFAGTSPLAQVNIFKGSDFTFLDAFKFVKRKQVFTTGIDINFSKIKDIILVDYFGSYRFKSLDDFFSNAFPSRFSRTVSLVDEPKHDKTLAAAIFKTGRTGFFVNDDIQINSSLHLNAGIRIDGNALLQNYKEDVFFNTVAKPAIEKYYDLQGAKSGQVMKPHWQLAPRFGFVYKIADEKIIFRGGAGIFTGHILNIWASNIYLANAASININPKSYGIKFNPDPYNQPNFQKLGINPDNSKGDVVVVAKNYKYPTVFRSSLGMDKKFKHEWLFTSEFIFTRNIHENNYTNVNLLPPVKRSASPDSRNIFSLSPTTENIPINGGNPYNSILLLSNYKGRKGFSYSFTALLSKAIEQKIFIEAAYTYVNSFAVFEPTANAGPNFEQWRQSETVNGKNYSARTVSDFDLRHRVVVNISKKLIYGKNKASTLVTVSYNGQSGAPYSFVYSGGMINDNGPDDSFDLIYIPTTAELNNMIFLTNTVDGVTYTPEQQKNALNEFIAADKYLGKHRGQFAERNSARLPSSHIIDLRLQQDFVIKMKAGKLNCSIIYDVFNFTNMLNHNWGRIQVIQSGNYDLITFAGFVPNSLTPQYQFNPSNINSRSVQTSTAPGSSSRWISQLGFRINFN